ncbi:PL29 family lyase N-terminal domain-containing protein [Phocaeicola sp.]
MNKKFLSAILFGALMVTATGTFVSCKDYDDDIDRIDKELTDIKSQIAALQTAVDNGKWITSVEQTANGLTITMNDGKTYPVTNGKDGAQGEKGEAGDKVLIDATTGAITINGEATGFFATKNTETGKFAVPEIGEDGFWYVVNKEGKLEATSYKASPVSAVQDPNTKIWTLKVWNTETKKYDEISLPTAASLITDFEVMGLWNATDKEVTNADDGKTDISIYTHKVTESEAKAWKGPKAIVKNAFLISSSDNMLVRIAPTSLDASGTEFNFVNSKNNSPLGISLNAAAKFDGVLSRAAGSAGLYTVGVKTTMYTPGQNEDLAKLDGTDVIKTLFALQDISGGFTSPFTLGIKEGTAVQVTEIKVNDTKVGVNNASKFSKILIDLNKDNTITFDDPAGVYDAYITYSDADQKLFGLTKDNSKMTFKASIMPDIVTKASFDITIHYLTVEGVAKTRDVEVKVSSALSETVYEKSHKLIADKSSQNPNYFAIDLKTMKDNMGETNYAIFTKNVDLSKTTYTYTHLDADGETVTDVTEETGTAATKGITEYIVKENKAASETSTTAVADANFIKFAIKNETAASNFDLNTEYTVAVTFKDASGEELTTIKVKFTLTVPALKDLLTIEDAVYNKDAKSLFAYMTEKGSYGAVNNAPMYSFKKGFTSTFAETVKANNIVFEVDQNAEYAKDKKVSTVATIEGSGDAQYILLKKAGNDYPVYAKDVNVHIKSASYLTYWEYPIDEKKGEWYSFNIRLMSPITCDQASIEPADGVSIKIPATATDGQKVSSADFVAKTYNKVAYDIFQNWIDSKSQWKNEYISNVQFKSTNENVFVVKGKEKADDKGYVVANDAVANSDNGKTVNNGYVTVVPQQIENETTKDMEVVLTDIWGFTKNAKVAVTIQRNK